MKMMIPLMLVSLVGMVAFAQQEEEKVPASGISVAILVPDGGWNVTITEVRDVSGEVWVLAQLTKVPGMSIQALRTVSDSIDLDPAGRTVRVLVTGKTWNWPSKEPYEFLDESPSAKQTLTRFGSGSKLFSRP